MVYAFVEMNVSNPDSFDDYRKLAGDALAKHGGAVLVSGKESSVIEGHKTVPQIAAILSFPEAGAAQAWKNDPELQHVHDMRQNSGDVSILLVG